MEQQPIYTFTSHIDGTNATIMIYPDRVEWDRPRSLSKTKLSMAVMTAGMSAVAGVRNNKTGGTEVIPVKSISSVTTKRDGMLNTKVQVITSGNTVDFRVSHSEAAAVKDVLTRLMLGTYEPESIPSPSPPAPAQEPVASAGAPNVHERLAQLDHLRAAGIITDAEHQAQRQQIISGV